MTNVIALFAGACYSAAFVFPKPYCYVAAVVAAVGAILVRYR